MISLLPLIFSNLGFLFLEKESITPEKINNYELRDFYQFFTWAHVNIRNEKARLLLNEVQTRYEQLLSETYLKKRSWQSNPNDIQIPIKIWKL